MPGGRYARTTLTVATVTVLAAACGQDGAGAGAASEATTSDAPRGACLDKGEPFEGTTNLYIEHNATNQDTGLHGAFNQDLVAACVRAPDGAVVLLVEPQGRLGALGINQLFLESREPPADEYPISRLEADFPAGEYVVSGLDPDGSPRVQTAILSHAIPAAPVITAPILATEDAAESVALPASGFLVRWEPVRQTIDGAPLTITGYQVIVTKAEHEDPHGLTRPAYDVHLPPEATELAVVDGFLEAGTVYELEVLAIEETGNQTIALGFFSVAG